jgi:hypothetical protein
MGLLLSVEAGSIDLTKGLDKARTSHLDGINQKTDDEFIPLKQGLKVDKTGLISFVVPGETAEKKVTYAYVGLGPVPVKEMTKYALKLKTNLKYGFIAIFSVTFYHGEKPLSFSKIYAQGSADSPPMAESRSVFATPPGTDRIVLWMGVGTGGKKLLYPGVHITFSEIALDECGKLFPYPESGKNLISVLKTAFFAGPERIKPTAGIVDNVLHIKYKKGDYPYPLFRIPEGKYYGSLAKFSCRMRGEGRITPTIWWYRKHVGHYYDGALPVVLSGKWQRIEVFSYCRDASVLYASCALICNSKKVDMDIDEVSFTITGTDKK